MGTETKFDCYVENKTAINGGIPKLIKRSSSSNTTTAAAPSTTNAVTAIPCGANVENACNYSSAAQTNGITNGRDDAATVNVCIKTKEHLTINSRDASPTSCAVPFVPIHIDEHEVIDGAKEILKVIRPHWDLNAVQFKKFTDGITNKLVGCFYDQPDSTNCAATNGTSSNEISTANGHSAFHSPNSHKNDHEDSGNISDTDAETTATQSNISSEPTDNVVLVRVYGKYTDMLIDRKAERRNVLLLHTYGFAPSLYATFKNGLAYEYVPGVTLNTETVLEPIIWHLVARRIAEMHRTVKIEEYEKTPPVPMLWKKAQNFFDLVPERFSNAEIHKRLESTFLPISRIRDEFETLYKHLETLGSPLVFAHNDLLLGNVVYTESQPSVSFIDYEYADYNFQAYDIGNHFAEYAGVDDVDYSRYPTREFQLEWLRVYLQSYLGRSQISDADVERLYVQVNKFSLATHVLWTIWSLVQAEHSTIDFDYAGYAILRYNEYLAKKDEFLALDINASNNS